MSTLSRSFARLVRSEELLAQGELGAALSNSLGWQFGWGCSTPPPGTVFASASQLLLNFFRRNSSATPTFLHFRPHFRLKRRILVGDSLPLDSWSVSFPPFQQGYPSLFSALKLSAHKWGTP